MTVLEDDRAFLCLLIAEPDVAVPEPGPAEFADVLTELQSATAAMASAGVLVDSGPLQPPAEATMLRVRDGERLLAGPATRDRSELPAWTDGVDDVVRA